MIVYKSIFMMAALNFLSDNADISLILMAASFNCVLPFKLWFSWQVISYCILDIWTIMSEICGLYINLLF